MCRTAGAQPNGSDMPKVVQYHASWLAVNPVLGCLFRCSYCFLHRHRQTGIVPRLLASPTQSVDMLENHWAYSPSTPVCLMSATEPMGLRMTRDILRDLLLTIDNRGLANPVCIITKSLIPADLLETMIRSRDAGRTIIFYVTLSGLGPDFEPGLSETDTITTLQRLCAAGFPVLHYWRPVIPANAQAETMARIMATATEYSIASVIQGLKICPDALPPQCLWPGLNMGSSEVQNAECIWPKQAFDFYQSASPGSGKHLLLQSNPCALSYTLKQPDLGGFFGSEVCARELHCPSTQRSLCSAFADSHLPDLDRGRQLLKAMGRASAELALAKFGTVYEAHVSGAALTTEQVAALRCLLRCRVVADRSNDDPYWSSTIVGASPLIV